MGRRRFMSTASVGAAALSLSGTAHAATAATPMEDYWPGGTRPILDLQAECDVLAPRAGMNKLVEELGDRVSIAVVPNAGHALIPEQPALVVKEVLKYLKVQGH